MNIPYIIDEKLDSQSMDVWTKVFAPSKASSTDKTVEESLWRRTQSEANKSQSGWESENDKNRKIVYYRHEYDVINDKIALVDTYIYFCVTMDQAKYDSYNKLISSNLKNNWTKKSNYYVNGDLFAEFSTYENPKNRKGETTEFPEGYRTLELKIYSKKRNDSDTQKMIWNISKAGMRKSLPRKNPRYVKDISEICDLFPAQLELGCGPASEAGVLPLHTMHEIYSINEPFSKKFIMNGKDDLYIKDLSSNPEKAFKRTIDYYSRIIKAKPTEFYEILDHFYKKKLLVGPIITNNFDGIHLRYGIPELFVRTYDEVVVMPDLQFHPDARSLLVVGCHADRRSIELRARERGLKIIYIDPEGWWDQGEFRPYPLESPQPQDYIIKSTASQAFKDLQKTIQK